MKSSTSNSANTSMRNSVLIAVVLISAAGCSGMTTQEKNTAVGAGIGAVGGAILTGGSTAGTVGGAAVGGIIGHEVKKP